MPGQVASGEAKAGADQKDVLIDVGSEKSVP